MPTMFLICNPSLFHINSSRKLWIHRCSPNTPKVLKNTLKLKMQLKNSPKWRELRPTNKWFPIICRLSKSTKENPTSPLKIDSQSPPRSQALFLSQTLSIQSKMMPKTHPAIILTQGLVKKNKMEARWRSRTDLWATSSRTNWSRSASTLIRRPDWTQWSAVSRCESSPSRATWLSALKKNPRSERNNKSEIKRLRNCKNCRKKKRKGSSLTPNGQFTITAMQWSWSQDLRGTPRCSAGWINPSSCLRWVRLRQ